MKRGTVTMISMVALLVSVMGVDSAMAGRRVRKAAIRRPTKQQTRVDRKWEKRADKNKDGYVGPKEAKKAIINQKSKVNTKWEKRADTDGDGKVSKDEAKTARDKYLEERSEVDRKWEEKADRNGDGTIDATELKGWSAHAKARVNTKLEKKYDTDGDGWLSKDEAKKLIEDGHAYRRKKVEETTE